MNHSTKNYLTLHGDKFKLFTKERHGEPFLIAEGTFEEVSKYCKRKKNNIDIELTEEGRKRANELLYGEGEDKEIS